MTKNIILMDDVVYKLWKPKREVEEFEPIVIEHIENILCNFVYLYGI